MLRRALLGALFVTAGCRGCKSPPPVVVDAAPPPRDASPVDASIDAAPEASAPPEVRFKGKIGDVELLAGGRVRFTARAVVGLESVWEWDSTTPGAEPVGYPVGVDGEEAELFVGLGSVFVIQRIGGTDDAGSSRRVFELWDGTKRAKIKNLTAPFYAYQISHAVSDDKRRFLVATCPETKPEWHLCEVSVFALPGGTLVHRTVMPELHFERYFAGFKLSPHGRYFAMASGWVDSMIYDAESGALVYPAEEDVRPDLMSSDHAEVVYLGERRAVVAKDSDRTLILLDLATRAESGKQDYALAKNEHAFRPLPSPDGRRIATGLGLARGRELAIWNLDDDTTKRIPLVRACGGDSCSHAWVSTTEIELRNNSHVPAPERTRIDVVSGAHLADPAKMPSVVKDGFRVHYHRDKSAKELKDDPSETDTIATPNGTTLVLPTVDGVHFQATDGRILLYGTNGILRVIDREGHGAELRGSR